LSVSEVLVMLPVPEVSDVLLMPPVSVMLWVWPPAKVSASPFFVAVSARPVDSNTSAFGSELAKTDTMSPVMVLVELVPPLETVCVVEPR
jgi:hypothetical protein